MLRYVNDTNRTIHAFQMLPPPEIPPEQGSAVATDDGHFSTADSIPSPAPPPPSSSSAPVGVADVSRPLTIDVSGTQETTLLPEVPSSPLLSMDKVNAMLNADGESGERSRSPFASQASTALNRPEPGSKVDRSETAAATVGSPPGFAASAAVEEADRDPDPDPMLMGTGMWEWSHRDDFMAERPHHHHPPPVSAPPASPTSEHSGSFPADLSLNADYSTEAMFPQSPSSMDVEMDHAPSASDFASSSHMWPGGEEEVGAEGVDAGGDAGARVGGGGSSSGLMDQWQTCAICLEELMDSQLLTHQTCSGVFCHTCLEVSRSLTLIAPGP